MSLAGVGGSITNIVGIGIVGAVAVKTVDMVGNMGNNTKKKKRKSNNNMFDLDMDMGYGYNQPKRKGKRMDDIFGGEYF